MNIQRYETGDRMSRAVVHGDTLYLCGQVASDASGSIAEQTATMLDKVDELLLKYSSSREHLLSATLYIKSMDDFVAMNAVWESWVPAGFAPARACVEAAMARPQLLVEISVIAALK